MRPQDTAYIIERLAVRFMAMVADHERQLAEHRASFGARTEADAKIIAGLREELDRVRNSLGIQAAKEANKVLGMVEGEGLRGAAERVVKERDGLLTQVQDMRAEMERLSAQLGWERAEIKRLQWENATMHKDAEDGYAEAIKVLGDPIALSKERDALRAEVAALQERLRASIARGDFAQMEVAALMSQTSKQTLCDHPVTVKREPEVGDTVQLVKRPTKQDYELSWLDDWGKVGESFRAVSGVCTYNKTPSVLVEIRGKNYSWPLSCVEVVTEATHDTEAGKAAAAEAAVKTEPVADEIKVGDVVEVFQSTASCTFKTDIGTRGTVLQLDDSCVDTAPLDGFLAPKCNHVALCDVRKVTT